jgi:hypothetical protein
MAIRAGFFALSLAVTAALIAAPGVAQSTTGPPVALRVIIPPPSEHRSGSAFSPDIVVAAVDAQGNQVPATSLVTVSLGNDSGPGGELFREDGLTVSMSDAGGVAVFGLLFLDGIAGQSYSLAFTSPDLLMTTTQLIQVTPGVAQQLVITTQPGGAQSGRPLAPQPIVEIRDGYGNRVTEPYEVRAASSGGILSGSTRVSTDTGVAEFGNLSLATLATDTFRLTFLATEVATGGGIDTVSDPFTITSSMPQDWGLQGTRTRVRGKQGIRVTGANNDLIGQRVVPYYKLPGQSSFTQGTSRPLVNSEGEFRYQRRTGKKIYIYFATEDGSARSERITIRR